MSASLRQENEQTREQEASTSASGNRALSNARKAEAVTWLVCQRNGIKNRSRDYLRDLMGSADLSGISMYAIFEAANRVESRTQPGAKR